MWFTVLFRMNLQNIRHFFSEPHMKDFISFVIIQRCWWPDVRSVELKREFLCFTGSAGSKGEKQADDWVHPVLGW